MLPITANSLAVHVRADLAPSGPSRWWPPIIAAEDTVRRATAICRHIGVADQRVLSGERATREALFEVLHDARRSLGSDDTLILTFTGHTERGDRPIECARWCLFDGGLEISEIASPLARFAAEVQLVVIATTCYATAIIRVLSGAQPAVVLASCRDDQTQTGRLHSEPMLRLERFLCSASPGGTLDDLRRQLEHDTPDCERPCVWTNTGSWWSEAVLHRARCQQEVT